VPPVQPRVNPVWLTEVAAAIGIEGGGKSVKGLEEIEPLEFRADTMIV